MQQQQQVKRSGQKQATVVRLTTCSSSLKKPSSNFKAPAFSSTSKAQRSGTANSQSMRQIVVGGSGEGSTTPTSSSRSRRTSQSSLLAAAGRSSSRTSLMSDTTTVSVCSSLPASQDNGAAKSIRSSASSVSSAAHRPTKKLVSSMLSSSPTTSSSSTARQVPTLAMSLRDKDQQIKLLIKERDEQKFQADMMARRAEEWEDKFRESELEKSHVTSEADDEVVELRRLSQELEDENKKLAEQLGQKELQISDTQFKLDELECEKCELKQDLDDKEDQLRQMEQDNRELHDGKPIIQVTTERAISKQKYEREIDELKEKICAREEQMIQLRSSLEMRKNEVCNLQSHSGELEKKLKIECERNERHLKRIDEINLELKAAEAKLATKSEENDMYERQVKSLRQELRAAEEKLEQISLARKKDVDVLHSKLSAARRGSTTPTGSPQPSAFKTPTPQDELVRLQMEIRDLKDQLIDREAELDCNRRDIEVMRRKMETRTLEVDCNNQELARRCQDLLEQNRQSEDTVKQLLKSSTEHSTQLMRATEDLKEANGKCIRMREEINQLEGDLDEQLRKSKQLVDENNDLREENCDHKEQVELLRQQVNSLNEQLSELCEQLDVQTSTLHQDREALARQLAQNDIDLAQMRHDLATARQDLRTGKLQIQEVVNERERLRNDLDMKEKYIASRNYIIETLRHELEDGKKSMLEHKQRLETLRQSSSQSEASEQTAIRELKSQLELMKRELAKKEEETGKLSEKCERLQVELDQQSVALAMSKKKVREEDEEDELERFDEMRQKHSAELDQLKLKLKNLEDQLEEAKSATLKQTGADPDKISVDQNGSQQSVDCSETTTTTPVQMSSDTENSGVHTILNERRKQEAEAAIRLQHAGRERKDEYESQIEFLNSVVVDMQRKCDDYKNRLSQVETLNIMKEFDNLIMSNQPQLNGHISRASTLRRPPPPPPPPAQPIMTNGIVSNLKTSSSPSSDGGILRRDAPIITNTATLNRPSNVNGVRYVNGNASRAPYFTAPERPVRISGRPYCDICNIYDQHHTIYCPKVAEKLAARKVDGSISGGSQSSDSSSIISNNNNNNTITSNNNNNNNNNNNETGFAGLNTDAVNDMFREYEQSIDVATVEQYSTLRRLKVAEKPPRAYCDHCDLFGHTIKSCDSLKALEPSSDQNLQQSQHVQ